MGGSRGGTFYSTTPERLVRAVIEAETKAADAEFSATLGGFLSNLLANCNGRDVALVQERLEIIKGNLQDVMDGSFDQLYGGSVAKHTYVDGLSDIDSLILLNGTDLEDMGPQVALEKIRSTLADSLEDAVEISKGKMAVTIKYADGMVLQLLPSVRNQSGEMRVPSLRAEEWSKINPETFKEALTKRNEQCGGKLVPTIKLAKAVIGELPEAQRLSGYHVESLAIAAFRGYSGEKTTSAMLPFFFERARELVAQPLRDSTGQSVHVDDYLGAPGGSQRVIARFILERLAKRMRNATAGQSLAQWQAIFGVE